MSKFVPSPAQVTAALYHIRYEIEQLAILFQRLSIPQETFLINALIESGVVHLSILAEFFSTPLRDRHKDDVLAEDFGFPVSVSPIATADIERRNKEVAHLTYTRSGHTPEQWRWDFDRLVPPVLERARRFISHLVEHPQYIPDPREREEWKRLDQLLGSALANRPVVFSAGTAHSDVQAILNRSDREAL
jgi:hypothetical protein